MRADWFERVRAIAVVTGLSLGIAGTALGCGEDERSTSTGGSGGAGGTSAGGSTTGGTGTGGTSTGGGTGGIPMSGNVQYAATCEGPAPCGGDFTGTWTIDTVCTQVKPDLLLGCATSQASYQGQVSGTLTFTADMLSFDTSVQMKPTVQVGADCICPIDQPFGKECIQDCLCYSNLEAGPGGSTTVAVDGTKMALGFFQSDTPILSLSYQYCVQGDTLWLLPDADSKYPEFALLELTRGQ